jgi:hypothetical protein
MKIFEYIKKHLNLTNMKRYISVLVLIFTLIIVIALIYLANIYWIEILYFFEKKWVEEIIVSAAGGAIGGFVVYSYVLHTENKREARAIGREHAEDEREKKEKCTKALLSTQMAIMLQMDRVPGLTKIANEILTFKLSGETLEQRLKDIPSISEKANILKNLIKDGSCSIHDLIPFANYLLIQPVTNNDVIVLPYEIFEIPNMHPEFYEKKKLVEDFSYYFQDLASCNKRYTEIISRVMRNNEIRDLMIINQSTFKKEVAATTKITDEELDKLMLVIAGKFDLALELEVLIPRYLEKADGTLEKTAVYIKLLGISPTMHAAKDENGEAIFEKT